MTEITTDDILSSLDKKSLALVRLGRDITRETIPTASIGLNRILGGGLRLGTQTTIWGNEQSGKSALMMKTVALNQRRGIPCAWIDAEHSFDPLWAERLGIDVDALFVAQASSVADVANLTIQFINAGVKLLVIDSTSALKPASFFDDGELKEFEKTRQIGQVAKDLGNMSSYVQGRNFTCAVVHISQVRMDLSGFKPGMKPTGGMETVHTDQLRVRLSSSKSDQRAVMGKIPIGDSLVEKKIGRKVTWIIDKNKLNGREGKGEYDLLTLGDNVGVDRASEVLALAIEGGIVAKGGAWIKFDENTKFQGDEKAKAYLRENPEVMDELEEKILALPV